MTATALSDDELIELDGFLLSEACGDAAMPIDEVHGYLTALLVKGESLELRMLLPQLWGEPEFADEAERDRMHQLVQRFFDSIAAELESGRPFDPLVAEVEEEGEILELYEGWCYGFMFGVEQQEWPELPKGDRDLLVPIAKLALLHDHDDEDDDLDMDEEEYADWIELLPGAVAGLYRYWRQ